MSKLVNISTTIAFVLLLTPPMVVVGGVVGVVGGGDGLVVDFFARSSWLETLLNY